VLKASNSVSSYATELTSCFLRGVWDLDACFPSGEEIEHVLQLVILLYGICFGYELWLYCDFVHDRL